MKNSVTSGHCQTGQHQEQSKRINPCHSGWPGQPRKLEISTCQDEINTAHQAFPVQHQRVSDPVIANDVVPLKKVEIARNFLVIAPIPDRPPRYVIAKTFSRADPDPGAVQTCLFGCFFPIKAMIIPDTPWVIAAAIQNQPFIDFVYEKILIQFLGRIKALPDKVQAKLNRIAPAVDTV